MRFKLDENLGNHGAEQLRAAGCDVSTVLMQNLGGAADTQLFQVCADEGRILLTLDFDFSQVLRFPPETSSGIVILSTSGRMTSGLIRVLLAQLVEALKDRNPIGTLWIVEPGRIRVHASPTREA